MAQSAEASVTFNRISARMDEEVRFPDALLW